MRSSEEHAEQAERYAFEILKICRSLGDKSTAPVIGTLDVQFCEMMLHAAEVELLLARSSHEDTFTSNE